ncbi:hypothetical protein GGX14DRAFT_637103 [Mycena pura]|uniref:Uncharacterized protein n=1 Tax=Mycena pura TaxID=153505 RepID=A0AAD6VDR4_9AGAR|nr:hypothetical protein GGX14DRAFT_637103 [Mycena pura]
MSFTFTNYDVQNSNVVPSAGSPSETVGFRIVTERSWTDSPKQTTLYRGNLPGSKLKVIGRIAWKEKTVELNGVSKPFKEVRARSGGTFSLTTEWQWDTNSKKYEVKFKKGGYVAKEAGEDNTELVATYTALKLKSFGKYVLPTLTFHAPGLSEDEMAGLIFALLFIDIKLPARKRPLTFKEAAGEVAVDVAAKIVGNVVGNAAGNCCVVQ